VRSPAIIRAGGRVIDGDMAPIDEYIRTTPGAAKLDELKPAEGVQSRWAKGEVRVSVGGTFYDLTPDQIFNMALNDGVAINARHSMDLLPGFEDGARSSFSGLAHTITNSRLNLLARANRRLGEFSATRDNLTRLAHYVQVLESSKYPTLDAARAAAAKEVHSYHPTIQTLGSFEQKVARRMVMYYTWVKQMASRVILTALERPALVTIPSKMQYNAAEANGLEPESFGKPVPSDPRIASYYEEGMVGPSWLGGYAPFSSVEDLPIDPETGEPIEPQMWGASLSSPQIDAMFTLFGGIWKVLADVTVRTAPLA
jgi:hypothetical protein